MGPSDADFRVDADGQLVAADRPPRPMLWRSSRFDRALFAEDLGALLTAGLTLHDALGVLGRGMVSAADRARTQALQTRLAQGMPLARAMAADAEAYGAVLIALVQASEQSASLAPALERFAADARQAEAARAQLTTALVYPGLLLLVGTAVAVFLLGWVVPRFSDAIDGQSAALSGTARTLLAAGDVLGRHRAWWIGALLLGAAALGAALWHPAGRQALLARAAAWPALRVTLRLVHASRFFATAGTLTQAGLPAPAAFELAAPLLMPDGRRHLAQALERLRSGLPLAASLDHPAFGDPVVGRLLEVGQRTGALPATLQRITVLLQGRAQRRIQRLVKVFEPALMVAMGVLIGGIVLLMYVPLLELSAALQ